MAIPDGQGFVEISGGNLLVKTWPTWASLWTLYVTMWMFFMLLLLLFLLRPLRNAKKCNTIDFRKRPTALEAPKGMWQSPICAFPNATEVASPELRSFQRGFLRGPTRLKRLQLSSFAQVTNLHIRGIEA